MRISRRLVCSSLAFRGGREFQREESQNVYLKLNRTTVLKLKSVSITSKAAKQVSTLSVYFQNEVQGIRGVQQLEHHYNQTNVK